MARTAQVTHDQLVGVARKWLRGQNCTVVITELTTYAGETPDAIGWRAGGYLGVISTLIECKTSLSDLKADLSKAFRGPNGKGMGKFRYYLVPAGAFKVPDDVEGSAFARWGILEWTGKVVRVTRASQTFEPSMGSEITLLTSAMRRAHFEAEGISVRFYTKYRFYEPKARATVTLTKRETCHGCKTRLAVIGSPFCAKCQEVALEDDCAPD